MHVIAARDQHDEAGDEAVCDVARRHLVDALDALRRQFAAHRRTSPEHARSGADIGWWGTTGHSIAANRDRRTRPLGRLCPGAGGHHGTAGPAPRAYDVTQPDYLLLNSSCGAISLYPFTDGEDEPSYAVGLHEWAQSEGYRWVGDACAVDPGGRAIEPGDFLPRRLMGEYLHWFYLALVAAAPAAVRVIFHPTAAVDLVAARDAGEEVHLADGEIVAVDHVIVTSGHTANENGGPGAAHPHQLTPYPVTPYVERLPAGATVAISGMGLVAFDVVTALTIGRGGSYVQDGDALSYVRSGSEPLIQLFSRSGLPATAKAASAGEHAEEPAPAVATPEALDRLSGRSSGVRRQVDLRRELLPILFAEMTVRYYARRAGNTGGAGEAAAVRERLALAWQQGRFEAEVAALGARFEPFDAEAMFFGHHPKFESREDYERYVHRVLREDLRESSDPASAVKAAGDVFRVFRDPVRSVVEYGGLSLDSYLDFNADIRSRMNRLVAGPPALRIRQLLALMDAGIVQIPYGPAPAVGPAGDGAGFEPTRTRISSTALREPHAADVDVVIRGHLDDPRIEGSASSLLTRLYTRGRISQFRYGTVNVGSVDLTPDSHPIDVDGSPQPRIWMFGVLTEGIRHFNQYIPSPNRGSRAVHDLGDCVAEILG
ncbi:MAG: FAD/NAD(P)-binding protein [Solirubrobacteraceae bacterium]